MQKNTPRQTLDEAKRNLTRSILLDALAAGASRTEACRAAGIVRQTLYNWLNDDPVFQEHVLEAEREAIQAVEAVAYRCAIKAEHDPRYQPSLRFFLKSRAGWNDRPAPPQPETPPDEYEQPGRQAILTRIRAILRRSAEEEGENFVDAFPDEPDDPEVRTQTEAELDAKYGPAPKSDHPVGAQHAAPTPPAPAYPPSSIPGACNTRSGYVVRE